jgi:hypothetical protein
VWGFLLCCIIHIMIQPFSHWIFSHVQDRLVSSILWFLLALEGTLSGPITVFASPSALVCA